MVSFATHRLNVLISKQFFEDVQGYQQCSIEDPRSQDQLASDLPVMDIFGGEAGCDCIVCSPSQNEVNESHAAQQRYHAPRHNPIFHEQFFRPHIATAQADDDDHQCKARAPP